MLISIGSPLQSPERPAHSQGQAVPTAPSIEFSILQRKYQENSNCQMSTTTDNDTALSKVKLNMDLRTSLLVVSRLYNKWQYGATTCETDKGTCQRTGTYLDSLFSCADRGLEERLNRLIEIQGDNNLFGFRHCVNEARKNLDFSSEQAAAFAKVQASGVLGCDQIDQDFSVSKVAAGEDIIAAEGGLVTESQSVNK